MNPRQIAYQLLYAGWIICFGVVSSSALAAPDVRIEKLGLEQADNALVTIVQVSDGAGEPDMDVSADQFEVDIAGEPRVRNGDTQAVRFEKTGQGFKTIMLIDTSCSMRNSKDKVREAAKKYVDGMSANDEAIIGHFGNDVMGLDVPWTKNKAGLKTTIDKLSFGDGETKFYDALDAAVQVGKAHPDELVTVLVLSDGKDDGSVQPSHESAVSVATKHDIRVGSVGYVIDPADDHTKILADLATRTGGRYKLAESVDAIEREFNRAQEAIHLLWVVTTEVGPVDKPYKREITVALKSETKEGEESKTIAADSDEVVFPTDWVGVEFAPDPTPMWKIWTAVGGALGLLIVLILALVMMSSAKKRRRALEEQMQDASDRAEATRRAQQETQAKLDALQEKVAAGQAEETPEPEPEPAPSPPPQPAPRRKTQFHDPSAQRFIIRLFDDGRPVGILDLGVVGDTMTLGSDATRAAVALTHETVSGLHAQIHIVAPYELMVTDLGSSNGTYVNGDDIRQTGPASTQPGKMIQLGLLQIVVEMQ